MEKEKIIDYIKKRKMITVPTIQKRFSLSYNQAKNIFAELVEEGKLFFASGITYNVRAEEPKMPEPAERPSQRFSLAEYMRKRSLLRPEETDSEDDEEEEDKNYEEIEYDDDDDEESRAYERLRESLREKIDRKSVDDSEDKSEDSIRQMRERIGNLGKLFSIKKIFNDSLNQHCDSKYVDNKMSNVICLNGEQFKLDYDDGILQITYDGYAPGDCISAMLANSIMKEYKSLHYKADAIVATVENNADALDVLLELFAAVERIKHGGE